MAHPPPSIANQPESNHKAKKPSSRKLWWFMGASLLAHGLGLILISVQPANKIATTKENKPQPIEFVVVPEAKKTEVKPTDNNNNPEEPPASSPSNPPAPAPAPAPSPQPEPSNETPVEPAEPAEPAEPEPAEPTTEQNTPAPQAKLSPTPPPQPTPAENKPTPADNGAASLLGGDYQKSLSSGGSAFFSPEALAYKSVLTPSQIGALQDIDLQPYYAHVKRTIDRTWRPTYTQNYIASLTVTLDKQGQIVAVGVARSSGSPDFDQTAIDTFKKAAPFGPLPSEYPLDTLEFNYGFEFNYILR